MPKINKDVAPLHSYILLDRTYSMKGTRWTEAVGSINGYVQGLIKSLNKEVKNKVTLAVFDTQSFDFVDQGTLLTEWGDLAENTYEPRGSTNLYDSAVKLLDKAIEENNERTAVIIMTDGEENSSRKYNNNDVKARIKKCEDKGWTVTFLGADLDISTQSINLDNYGNTISVSTHNLRGFTSSLASSHAAYSETGIRPEVYNVADRAAAVAPNPCKTGVDSTSTSKV